MIDTRRIALRRPALEFPPDLLCSGTDGKEEDLRMRFANRTTRHASTDLASATNSKGVIGVSVCGDFLNVFLKKSFSSQSLILSYVNEFVCQQSQIVSAVRANNDAVPRRQTVVSAERGKSRSFMRSSFEVRPTQ
jgi:hypothetical protein